MTKITDPRASWAPPGPALATALVAVLCLIWGSTWLVIREGLKDLPPFSSAAIRFAVAAFLMIGVARLLAGREGGTRPSWRLVLVMGGLHFAGSYGIVYWAEQFLPSAHACILWAVFPLLMAITGHVALPGERLRPIHGVGFLAGFAGVVLLFATDVRGLGPDGVLAAGVLLVSPLIVAIGTAIVKRYGAGASSLLLNRDGMLLGALLLAIVAVAFERDAELRFTRRALFSIAYLAVAGTVITFTIYFWLLRHAPAYKLSVIPYVLPAVALVLGYFLADEPIGPTTVIGFACIVVGVLIVTLVDPREGPRAA